MTIEIIKLPNNKFAVQAEEMCFLEYDVDVIPRRFYLYSGSQEDCKIVFSRLESKIGVILSREK